MRDCTDADSDIDSDVACGMFPSPSDFKLRSPCSTISSLGRFILQIRHTTRVLSRLSLPCFGSQAFRSRRLVSETQHQAYSRYDRFNAINDNFWSLKLQIDQNTAQLVDKLDGCSTLISIANCFETYLSYSIPDSIYKLHRIATHDSRRSRRP
ncbi:hypothetical protein BU16DRAFT_139093 [Lophium mytilinum]|uniref:Uncharacterized protein n=1 Tax=Lophium mytilinum TaxID=390894 RepID=A0A6A6QF89_9PEZI|nr:hypothetical protein BU16DRAFT_139093 [Lophium mytilinum]